jgi:hypothetical protein
LLGKNFEKLVQCDQRLNQLSQQPDIILDSPVFEPRCSIFEDPVELKHHDFANLKDEHEDLPGYSGSVSPCAGSSMSAKNEANDCFGKQPAFLAQTINPGTPKSTTANMLFFTVNPIVILMYCSQNRGISNLPLHHYMGNCAHDIVLENFSQLAPSVVMRLGLFLI